MARSEGGVNPPTIIPTAYIEFHHSIRLLYHIGYVLLLIEYILCTSLACKQYLVRSGQTIKIVFNVILTNLDCHPNMCMMILSY